MERGRPARRRRCDRDGRAPLRSQRRELLPQEGRRAADIAHRVGAGLALNRQIAVIALVFEQLEVARPLDQPRAQRMFS